MTSRFSRHGIFCALAWVLCASLYLWTAEGVSIKYGDRENAWHHYEYLVDGFLSGHLYLSREPAPELLALPDPYNPEANLRHRLWDASLYQGKYYLYYGPTPALLLMLPWKVVTGQHLPQWAATAVFAIAGLGALALLLARIREKYFPTATPAQLFFAVVLVGHVAWLPVILRRPAFWELPIVTAAALLWWSFFFLWKYHETGRRARWAVASGIALAFALGARPTYLFTATLITLLFALPFNRQTRPAEVVRRLLPVATPIALGIAALLTYNYQRFGAPFEFGQRFQLWGMDERTVSHFSLRYVPFNTWLYFFSLPEFSPYFPFVRTVWPETLPAGYIATEEIHGLMFALPALALGAFAWFRVSKSRGDPAVQPLLVLLLAATTASVLAASVLCCFAGACSRYIVEILAGWSVVAGIGFIGFFSGDDRSRPQFRWRLLAGAAVGWSMIYVWLASLEFRVFARTTNPEFYGTVARALNYPSYWIAQNSGQIFGPVALDVRFSPEHATGSVVLLAAGRPGMMNQLMLERLASGEVQLRLQINDIVVVETPAFRVGTPTLRVECYAPWLYPPLAHPYWQKFSSDAERQQRQSGFAIVANGAKYGRESSPRFSAIRFDALHFDPAVRRKDADPASCAWVEHWSRLEAPIGR